MVLQEPFSILHRYAILTTSMFKIIWSHALAHFRLEVIYLHLQIKEGHFYKTN